jgi:hypothetical protein
MSLPPAFNPANVPKAWQRLQSDLQASSKDDGKLAVAVQSATDDPVWRFLTPDRGMLWSNGLDGQSTIGEAFRLFANIDEALEAIGRCSYPAARFYRLRLHEADKQMALELLVEGKVAFDGNGPFPGFHVIPSPAQRCSVSTESLIYRWN